MADTPECTPAAEKPAQQDAGQIKKARDPRFTIGVLALVVMVFAGVMVAKTASPPAGGQSTGGFTQPTFTAPNDAVADYVAAVSSGRPAYILFHSNSCPSCEDITTVANEVLPAYEGDVAFVDAITDDARARELASKFSFQYIPTSFFINPDGEVVDSHTGSLTEDELRERLDRLVAE